MKPPRPGTRRPFLTTAADDGWFRVDLRKRWIDFGEILFIKQKALA